MLALLIIIALIVWLSGGSFYISKAYNTLKDLDNRFRHRQGDVEVLLQRKLELVRNIVAVVSNSRDWETELIGLLAKGRGNAHQTLVENYPQLKTSQNFLNFQSQLEKTEDLLVEARKEYNSSVSVYNVYVDGFPQNLIAKLLGFAPKAYFEAEEMARHIRTISF